VAGRGSAAAWGSFLTGLASVATLPIAIYLTRFGESYELLHAGFAIPIAAGLGFVALALARRARFRSALTLGGERRVNLARVGRVLGVIGLCMAAAGVISSASTCPRYVGSRD
jgi:hypothetical protein